MKLVNLWTIFLITLCSISTIGSNINSDDKNKVKNADITVVIKPGTTIAVVLNPLEPKSEYDNILIEETKNCFKEKGLVISDSAKTADFIISPSITTSKVDGNFNPVGCLVCGIFGAIKKEATINVKAAISKNTAQLWNNNSITTTKGDFLFGIFADNDRLIQKTIKTGVYDLFKTFIIKFDSLTLTL